MACSYLPGDVCIFLSSRIVHKVETFYPLPQTPEEAMQGITPGRIGTVLFFPKPTLELLKGKGPGWAVRTAHGRYEHLYPPGTFLLKKKEEKQCEKTKGKGNKKGKGRAKEDINAEASTWNINHADDD